VILNPDNRGRFRRYIYSHQANAGSNCRGRKQSKEEIEKRLHSLHKHFNSKKPTGIELALYNFLDSTGLSYEKQKQIGKTLADAFVPSLKLALYADGRYWHDKPDVIVRDLRANAIIRSRGYNLMRLSSIDNGYHLDLKPLVSVVGALFSIIINGK